MFLFKKVTITNFKAIGEATLDLDNRGLVLIEGINHTNASFASNGSAKSTLLDAITWALYDTTATGAKGDKLVNNKIGKNTHVQLDFEVDGTPYTIDRYRKHSKFKNTVKLHQADIDLTQKSVGDTNTKIGKLFGIDFKTYLNSVMYGQGDVEIFSQATDKGKKEILENVTNIAIYQKAQDVAKEKAVASENVVADLARKEVELTNDRTNYVNLAEQSKGFYEQAKANKEKQEVRLQQAKEQANKIAAEQEEGIAESTQVLETVTNTFNALEEVFTVMAEPDTLLDTSKEDAEIDKLQGDIQSLTTAYNVKVAEVQSYQKQMSDLDTASTCSYCGAPIDNTHKVKEAERLTGLINSINTAISPVRGVVADLEDKVTEIKKEVTLKQAQLNESAKEYRAKEREVSNVFNQVNQAKNDLALRESNSSLASINAEIKTLTDTIAETQLPEVVTYEKELAKLDKEQEELIVEKTTANYNAEAYRKLANDVFSNKGIRSVVLDLVTPFLNEQANKYLASLAGSDISLTFSTQTKKADGIYSDKFDVSVTNASGGSDYSTNSAGEKKRIDLAIALAIQDLVMSKSDLKTNIALYDECFDGLDAVGCENVIALLKEKQKEIGTIFVITHNEHLKSLFENVITVEKTDGISKVIGGINE
jgi:DNA repair exonuclease SbcCD ATPase subunit